LLSVSEAMHPVWMQPFLKVAVKGSVGVLEI